ncbi:MAG: hypothetical protein M1548_00140 [Actinobacteria bacterium]|nr:hypothetical protein [Actinomycetota bacterium]
MAFEAKCLPTAIGSLPHTGVDHATRVIFKNFLELPFWPQMPNASFRENMYVQFIEGLPGVVVDEENEKVYFDTSQDIASALEKLYEAYLVGDLERFALNKGSARGLYAFLDVLETGSTPEIQAVKGQITGPISLGLAVTDENRRPSLYNDVIRDATIKFLSMNIKWQESVLRAARPEAQTLIFIDEPYLVSYGSAYISLSRDDAIGYLDELISSAESPVGIHCCGNTDWSILTDTKVDIISFDSYDYAQSLALYADQIEEFLDRGGILAWGAVPSGLPTPDQVENETVDGLVRKLEDSMELLVEKRIDKEILVHQALITPSCGTAAMTQENAELAFAYTRAVSDSMRERYFKISD